MSLRDLWMHVYIAAIRAGAPSPKWLADKAISDWKESWEGPPKS